MSLTSALISSKIGIYTSEQKLSVTSNNVNNADKDGYTRKSYATDYITSNGTTYASQGDIEATVDNFLTEKAVESNSAASYAERTNAYMEQYDQALGSTGGENNLTQAFDELTTSIESLSVTSDYSSEKINVVQAADDLAYQLNRQSQEIQELRGQADREIGQTVDEINALLEEIDELNDEIIDGRARGVETADLEDERLRALEDLSGLIEVQYHFTDQGRLQLYSSSGQLLLGSSVHALQFSETSTVTGDASYAAGTLSGVTVDGVDITGSIDSGELGALLDLRDTTLVAEQAKLDEFATELTAAVNALHNDGTSIPAPETLTGSVTGLTGAESLAGSTGTLRVASVDATGTVQEFLDIDLTTVADVNALVAQIDAMANIDAALDANGAITITSSVAGNGVSLGTVSGSGDNVNGTGQSVSSYFGLNDLFTGTGAEDIAVRQDILDTPDYLAVGALNDDAALAVGDAGIYEGDASVADALVDLFSGTNAFDAAGDISARSDSFSGYLSTVISSASLAIEDAATDYDNAKQAYDTAKEALSNFTGVNLDEETLNMEVIQSAYEASSTIISTIQEMFDSLIDAVN